MAGDKSVRYLEIARKNQSTFLLSENPRKRLSQSCIPLRTKDENISLTANARVTLLPYDTTKRWVHTVLTYQLVFLSGRNSGQSAPPPSSKTTNNVKQNASA